MGSWVNNKCKTHGTVVGWQLWNVGFYYHSIHCHFKVTVSLNYKHAVGFLLLCGIKLALPCLQKYLLPSSEHATKYWQCIVGREVCFENGRGKGLKFYGFHRESVPHWWTCLCLGACNQWLTWWISSWRGKNFGNTFVFLIVNSQNVCCQRRLLRRQKRSK